MSLRFFIIASLLTNVSLLAEVQIEEIIVTGSILNNAEENSSPVEIINEADLKDLNILTIGEISKYITSASGSHFQTNSLDGTDQGMSSITLRGLDHSSTLVLINNKRQTAAGTTSNDGEGYIDINIIPQIALREVQILKEGASSSYGSDAIAGVVNFLTYKNFKGSQFKFSNQQTTNYNQKDISIGFLHGKNYKNSNFVFGIEYLDRSPLNAKEIPGIAELGLSTLGNSFKLSADDEVSSGPYQGSYIANQWVPDPSCETNGGVLAGSFCKFLYGERFNIINTEKHVKSYIDYSFQGSYFQSRSTIIFADISIKDNPQSPSYPALSFLSRKIGPGVGGSPFNVPVTWFGRPLGSAYSSPNSPKDISQYHINHSTLFEISDISEFEISISNSKHANVHLRPDTIDSRFEDALSGNGGPSGNLTWNIFDVSNHDPILIDYISGFEKSKRTGELLIMDGILRTNAFNMDAAFGIQISKDKIQIQYDDSSVATFDENGFLIKAADLLFLGGGKNISKSRNKKAIFSEFKKTFNPNLNMTIASRYEEIESQSSFDPKISFKYTPNDSLIIRASSGTSFVAPSMAQLHASEILLGTIRGASFSDKARVIQVGNPDLKPASANNSNIGVIWFLNNTSKASLDYWSIDYKNRVELENGSVKAAENPNSPDIVRNNEGYIVGVHTSFFNESSTKIKGVDATFETKYDFDQLGSLTYKIKASSFLEYLTPDESTGLMKDRVGYFNYDAHMHSIPKHKINSFLSWRKLNTKITVSSRFISSYKNKTPISDSHVAIGYKNKVNASLMIDVGIEKNININSYDVLAGINIINLFDEEAPRLYNPPDFSFDPRTHDARGRLINFSINLNF